MSIIHLLIQIFGAFTGIIAVYLNSKQHPFAWLLSIFGAIASIIVYIEAALYAEIFLQIVFIILSLVGFLAWRKTKKEEINSTVASDYETKNAKTHNSVLKSNYLIQPSYLSFIQQQFLLPIFLVLTAVFVLVNREISILLNKSFEFSISVIADASVTSLSLIATFLLAKKKIENWLLWYIANIISISLFIHKQMYIYALLYIVYWILGIYGWNKWLLAKRYK